MRIVSKRRGSQVVRQRSAKPLFGGSIPPRASNTFSHLQIADNSVCSFATLRKLPCDVFLAAHGPFYDLETKYAKLGKGGGEAVGALHPRDAGIDEAVRPMPPMRPRNETTRTINKTKTAPDEECEQASRETSHGEDDLEKRENFHVLRHARSRRQRARNRPGDRRLQGQRRARTAS